MKPGVLIVDDERRIRLVLKRLLESKGYRVSTAADAGEAFEAAEGENPDVVLLDLRMPGRDGVEVLRGLKEKGFEGKIIIMTAYGSIESAVSAMRCGAYDYITKPFRNEELLLTIERAMEHQRLKRDLKQARRQLREKHSMEGIVTASPAMLAVLETLTRIAPTDAPVLIHGESGTGKELVARAIHQESERSDGPFLAINCSSVPSALVESELFGYKRGAFTGAERTKPGLVAKADGGTLFLDEIGELSSEAQAKMLRFTQSMEFIPLGATEPLEVDVRLLAASNRDLESDVARGRFRADLYYRLNVVNLRIPPLRERAEDVPLLVEQFTKKYGAPRGRGSFTFTPEAMDLLARHDWPGNVRELENAVRSALVMSTEPIITADFLPVATRSRRAAADEDFELTGSLEEMLAGQKKRLERRAITEALRTTGGNRTRAAARLGVSRNTLIRKLGLYGIK